MPTYEETKRFNSEYNRLSADKRALFNQARKEWVIALKAHQPPPARLGIRRFLSIEGMYEFHFAPNGRALFRYGPERKPGEVHVIWERIGGHAIY
ncbi:MAG TPA: hypothetical protein VFU69_16950 [Ktedonobacterales bacterium]|nr:hypothetical protein [Ktedonobacterales bacterium]